MEYGKAEHIIYTFASIVGFVWITLFVNTMSIIFTYMIIIACIFNFYECINQWRLYYLKEHNNHY